MRVLHKFRVVPFIVALHSLFCFAFVSYCLCRSHLLAFSVSCWLLSLPLLWSVQFSFPHLFSGQCLFTFSFLFPLRFHFFHWYTFPCRKYFPFFHSASFRLSRYLLCDSSFFLLNFVHFHIFSWTYFNFLVIPLIVLICYILLSSLLFFGRICCSMCQISVNIVASS